MEPNNPLNQNWQTVPESLQYELSDRLRSMISKAGAFDFEEYKKRQVEAWNARPGTLDGDCGLCLNKGYILRYEEGHEILHTCKCAAIRLSQQRLERTGLAAVADLYTIEAFTIKEPWQKTAKHIAEKFISQPDGSWLAMFGQPGCGKTHLCTAVAVATMRANAWDMRYMPWKDESTRIKAVVTDDEAYQVMMAPLKTAKILYIDDFFKTERNNSPTPGDVNLAFELINYRYNNPQLVTILSSERNIDYFMDIDEAIGSRIRERTKGFCFEVTRDSAKNYRLR